MQYFETYIDNKVRCDGSYFVIDTCSVETFTKSFVAPYSLVVYALDKKDLETLELASGNLQIKASLPKYDFCTIVSNVQDLFPDKLIRNIVCNVADEYASYLTMKGLKLVERS